jgi:hypothetical protein
MLKTATVFRGWHEMIAGLTKARSHIAFCIGLCLAAGIALSMETGISTGLSRAGKNLITQSIDQTPLAVPRPLKDLEYKQASIAWAYFESNLQEKTGLVNSAHNFPSTTIWDQASYLLALISAERIGIIDTGKFDKRMAQVLYTLANLPLFDNKLPNKVYDTRSVEMTDYTNTPNTRGIGWSALDIARVSVPLNLLVFEYPQHASAAHKILTNWQMSELISNGALMGARVDPETNKTEKVQEGRLGYEEYGARAITLLGLDAYQAVKYDDYLKFEDVSGQSIALDSRSFSEFDAHNYVVSEPYILAAIEFGLDFESRELAHRVYKAQEGRYTKNAILTAVSEDNIDQAPYFIYNTVFANEQEWNPLAEDGTTHPDKRTVSTKAVFGWDALYRSDYTRKLMDHVAITKTESHGWNSGVYESDGRVNAVSTANTNGIILETIQYKMNGPLLTGRYLRKGRND